MQYGTSTTDISFISHYCIQTNTIHEETMWYLLIKAAACQYVACNNIYSLLHYYYILKNYICHAQFVL